MKTGRLLWFVHGNMESTQAIGLVEKARSLFNIKPTAKEDLVDIRCIALQPGNYQLEMELDDKTNENNCLFAYFEYMLE